MNFKTKNEKGLMLACEHCDWKMPLLENEKLKIANMYYREHKCLHNIGQNVFSPRPIIEQKQEQETPIPPMKEEDEQEQMMINDPVLNLLQEVVSQLDRMNKRQEAKMQQAKFKENKK